MAFLFNKTWQLTQQNQNKETVGSTFYNHELQNYELQINPQLPFRTSVSLISPKNQHVSMGILIEHTGASRLSSHMISQKSYPLGPHSCLAVSRCSNTPMNFPFRTSSLQCCDHFFSPHESEYS